MKLFIRSDSVVIEGYVNAIERNSKPLNERGVRFVERIKAGAFGRALKRAKNVKILLNHDKSRVLGGTAEGTLELEEDSIGLKARATITDPEVIDDARNGNLVGWSFGFYDLPEGVTEGTEDGVKLRSVKDLDLREVSVLDDTRNPAYEGTLIEVRDDAVCLYGDTAEDELIVREEQPEAPAEESAEPERAAIDYSAVEQIIKEMKGEQS